MNLPGSLWLCQDVCAKRWPEAGIRHPPSSFADIGMSWEQLTDDDMAITNMVPDPLRMQSHMAGGYQIPYMGIDMGLGSCD